MDNFTCHQCKQSLDFSLLSRDEDALLSGRTICRDCLEAWKTERLASIAKVEALLIAEQEKAEQEQATKQKCARLGISQRLFVIISTWPIQWRQGMESFLESLFERSESQGTLMNYATKLAAFYEDGKLPDTVTHRDVDAFLRKSLLPVGGEIAPATRNCRKAVLSSWYKFVAGYWVEGPDGQDVPLFQGHLPTLGVRTLRTAAVYRAWTEGELHSFFKVIPADVRGLRDKAVLTTLFFTARRRSEIANLKWGNIAPAVFTDDEGHQRQGWTYTWKGKGHRAINDDDRAELPSPCKAHIDAYLAASGRLATIADDDPLFLPVPSRTGGGLQIDPKKPLSGNAIWCSVKLYAAKAGLDYKRLTVHGLRHSCVQQRWKAGDHDVLNHKRLLRHESLETTGRYLERLITVEDPSVHLLQSRFSDL